MHLTREIFVLSSSPRPFEAETLCTLTPCIETCLTFSCIMMVLLITARVCLSILNVRPFKITYIIPDGVVARDFGANVPLLVHAHTSLE